MIIFLDFDGVLHPMKRIETDTGFVRWKADKDRRVEQQLRAALQKG